jgi:uncharacterized membrane protein
MDERRERTDQRVDEVISKLLLFGVSAAALVTLAGGVLFLGRHGQETPHFEVFRGEPAGLRTVAGVLEGVAQLQARAVIQLGLGLLVATPIARVAFSLFAFARQRDWLYVAITGIVLGILLFALFVDRASSPLS